MPPSAFAALLRRLRHAAGFSQEELGNRAGLSGDAVASLERGRRRLPRPQTVRLLAEALELTGEDRAAFIGASRKQEQPVTPPARRAPLAPDELVGRSSELADVVRLLTEGNARLVTLTGPGGVGKTRLAIEVAGTIEDASGASVSWVPLAPSSDEPTVAAAIASAVGAHMTSERHHLDVLIEHLAGEHLVLLLDNCEHVIEAAAAASDTLLRHCPGLRIVATSRELLRVQGETVKPVQPLAPADAMRMFVIRATAHGFRPAGDDVAHVRRICQRLNGIPLAIELAAARVNVLTVEQIAGELETSFDILSAGNRTAPERQHTLHAAIDWSHQLLASDERRFFAALSVFSGGWTIPAAQALHVADDPASRSMTTINLTGQLADKSLIVVRRNGPAARYEMYDVIREFAAERLDEDGRRDRMELAHLRYFIGLAEDAESEIHGPEHMSWMARLDAELDNFRVAMQRAVRRPAPIDALRLAGALSAYCYLRGHYSEGRTWLAAALRADEQRGASPAAAALRAKVWQGSGYLAFLQCEYDQAAAALESAHQLYRELGDRAGVGRTVRYLGSIARERGEYDVAEDLHRQGLQTYTALDDDAGVAWARHHLGFVCWLREDWPTAREHAQAAHATFRAIGDGEGIVWSLIDLGTVSLYEGDLDESEAMLRQALTRAQGHGYREGVAWSQNQLGVVAAHRMHPDQAVAWLAESLSVHQELGDRWRSASVLEALAMVVCQRDQAKRAAFLLGVAAALRDEIGAPVPACERAQHETTLETVRSELGSPTFTATWAEGRETPPHQV